VRLSGTVYARPEVDIFEFRLLITLHMPQMASAPR